MNGPPAILRNRFATAATYVPLIFAVFAGLWGRLIGFGSRPLAVDEYYFAKSIELILAWQVPRFVDGGYYVQGLMPQYVTALSVTLFGENEAAYRLPALLAGLLVPFLAYRYARRHLPATLAATVAVTLLVSSWEIEFSRFARMYAPLQCVALAFLIRFDDSIVGEHWKLRYRAHAWAVLAVLSHSIGVLLAPLLYAPLLEWKNPQRFPRRRDILEYGGLTSLVTMGLVFFVTFDFRRWGVDNLFPPGYTPPDISPWRTPAFPFWSISEDPHLNLAVIIAALLLTLLGLSYLAYKNRRLLEADIVIALLVISAALHQFMIASLLSALVVFRHGFQESLQNRRRRGMLSLAAALSLGWVAAAFVDVERFIEATGAAGWTRAVQKAFFGWPNFFDSLWRPWSQDLPLIGLLTLAAVWVLLARKAKEPWIEILRGPAGVLAYCILCFGLLKHYDETTRYAFFLYPVSLTAIALALSQLKRLWLSTALYLVAFCLSSDFDPRHIANAGTPEVALRLGRYETHRSLWYSRHDYRAAAESLDNAARREPLAAVVIGNCRPMSYYLQAEHAIYLDRKGHVFHEVSRANGSIDLWARKRLLSTPAELREHIGPRTVVWLARALPRDVRTMDPSRIWGDRIVESKGEFLSLDGGVEILRITLRPASPE